MDIPVKKLVRLLKADQRDEVRAAAVVVFGELAVKDAEASAELIARLDDDSADVRLAAIDAVGKLKLTKALPVLLDRIKSGGPESSASADAAANLGAEGVKGLQSLLHTVAPGLRRYIAAALTSAGSGGAEAGVTVLLDKDPQIVSAAANAIVGRLPTMPPDRKKELVAELVALAKDKKKKLLHPSELAVAKILTSINDPAAAEAMWDRVLPPHPVELRAAALQAVGGWTPSPNKEQLRRLFQCAADTNFQIAAPALMILNKLPNAEKHVAEWVTLLTAPDVAARRLAMEKVGEKDTKEVADGLMAQLTHPDRNHRDTARAKLAKIEHGRQALAAALKEGTSSEEMWALARSIAPFVGTFPEKIRGELFATASKYIEASDSRLDPLLFLLREANATAVRDQLFDQAVAKRKKKDYETAIKYLKHVARDPSAGFPIRLELAMVGLKMSSKDLAADARSNDRCLGQFEHIVGQDSAEVLKAIEKAKWLEPEDLFYLGFHFAERFAKDKEFGAAVLKLITKNSPKSKVAAAAKNKLKTIVL